MTRHLPDLRERTLPHAFARALAEHPDRVAQTDSTGSWTYSQAYDRCLRLAGGLAALGVPAGAPVAGLLDNSLDAVHLYFGLGLTGRVQVPINTAYKGSFLSHVLNDCGAQMLVLEDRYCARLAEVADDVPGVTTVVVRGGSGDALPPGRFRTIPFAELDAATAAAPVPAEPWDVQAYVYTSGTTGASKGCRVTHAQAYTYASREDDPRASSDDRVLVVLPMFHLAGQFYGVYQALISRGTCVVEAGFSTTRFWDVVREHRITSTLLVGGMAQMLAQRPPSADDCDNPLRLVHMAPLVAEFAEFGRRFDVEVAAVYGSTETGSPISSPPDSVVGGECGYPRAEYRTRIVDEHDIDVEPGAVGELLVRADLPWIMFDGYVGRPEATAEVTRNYWFHTGDAFRADETGRLFFVDRIKDALRRRGENVSSFEVESVVDQYPPILESAAVAVPSELAEDEIKVVVVLREGAEFSPEALIEFLVPRMPYFMVPRYVEVIDSIPRTPTLKVQKNVLRQATTGDVWDRVAAGIVVTRDG